jgi:MFS family permease
MFVTNPVERSNYYHLVADIAWFGLAFAAINRFLTFYAIRLDASPFEQGLIAALPALMLLFSTGLSGWWRNRFHDSVASLVIPSLGFRLMFLLPAVVPWFPQQIQVFCLIMAIVLPAFPQGIANATFVVMMREAISDGLLPKLWGQRLVALNITLATMTILFGYMLEWLPFPLGYQLMFLLAFLLNLLSVWHVRKVKILYPAPVAKKTEIFPVLRLWRFPSFLRVAIVVLATYIAFTSVNAVMTLHLESNLGATEEFIGWAGVVELAAAAISAAYTHRLMAHFGSRHLITMSMVGTALAALVMAFAPTLTFTLIASALTGASWTAASIGILGYFHERTPAEDMHRMTVGFQQMTGIAMFIGPMIGNSLAQAGVGLVLVLVIGGVMRLIAAWLVLETGRPHQLPQFARIAAGD